MQISVFVEGKGVASCFFSPRALRS